jgi:hypothetical protein
MEPIERIRFVKYRPLWFASVPMSDRTEDLRCEAARCLALAKIAINPKVREELVHMAARFHDMANSVPADFGAILEIFNNELMARQPSERVAQQQQQIQPKKEGG